MNQKNTNKRSEPNPSHFRKWNQLTDKEKEKKVVALVYITLALIFGYMFLGGSGESAQPATTNEGQEDLSFYARMVSESMVEQSLKAPATAEYPQRAESIMKGYNGDSNTYRVDSYVDSKNSFGAKIRNDWITVLRYDGSGHTTKGSSWEFIYFQLGDQILIDNRTDS